MNKHRKSAMAWGAAVTAINVILATFLLCFALKYCRHERQTNAECDARCRAMQHPAGEMVPWMKHDACVCWPAKPEPAVHFLLERRD